MRLFLLLLALANVLFYLWASDDLAPLFGRKLARESGRLAAQVEPERLRVLRAGQGESAPGAAAATGGDNGARPPDAGQCRRFSGLKADQVDPVQQAIAQVAPQVTVRSREVVEPASWFVHVPADADKRTPAVRVAELRQQGVKDAFVVQSGRYRNAISLGVFKGQASANDLLQTLQKRGVKLARVGVWEEERRAVLEATGPVLAVSAAAAEVEKRFVGTEVGECR